MPGPRNLQPPEPVTSWILLLSRSLTMSPSWPGIHCRAGKPQTCSVLLSQILRLQACATLPGSILIGDLPVSALEELAVPSAWQGPKAGSSMALCW